MSRAMTAIRGAAARLGPAAVATALLLAAGCGSAATSATSARPDTSAASVSSASATTGAGPTTGAGTATGAGTTPGAGTAPGGGTAAPVPTTTTAAPPAGTAPAPASTVPRPHIVRDPIPFGPRRKAEMVAYARRHYGSFMTPTYRLVHPHVIVIHYTETPDFSSTFNTFAGDSPDPELHELPNTCAHFVVDASGTIHQLVPLGIMCRHTVGLNWTAIGIEHVAFSDQQVLGDRAQMTASLRLVRWLRCRYKISVHNVIGHNESLSSPYHREDVPSLRTQTHSDFDRADMQVYRRRLAAAGGCG